MSAETCRWLLGNDLSNKAAEKTLQKLVEKLNGFEQARSSFFNVIGGLESGELNGRKMATLFRDLKTILSKTGLVDTPYVIGLKEITINIDSNTSEMNLQITDIDPTFKEPIYTDGPSKSDIKKLNLSLKSIEDFLNGYKGEEGDIEKVKNRIIAITKKPVSTEDQTAISKTFGSLMSVYNFLFSSLPNILANVVRVGEKYTQDCIKDHEIK